VGGAARARRDQAGVEVVVGVPTVVFGYFALTFFTPTVLRDALALRSRSSTHWRRASSPGSRSRPSWPRSPTTRCAACRRPCARARTRSGLTVPGRRRVVAPAGLSGLAAAVTLGFAKAIGETMIVAIAGGGTAQLGLDPREAYQTMTAFIAQVGQSDVPVTGTSYRSLFAVGALLFVITLLLNVLTLWLVRRFRQRYE